MNYKLTLERMERLGNQISLVQNRIAGLTKSRGELENSANSAISQSDQPGADPEIAGTIDRINEIDVELKKQSFILDSLSSELKKLPVEDAQKMQQFETLYDEFKKNISGLDRFAEKWNAEVEVLESMAKKSYPNFVRFLHLYDVLGRLGRELKNTPDLCNPELVRYSHWGAIDTDVDCPYRLWRLFSKIPENGKGRWLNRRMRNNSLIETEN